MSTERIYCIYDKKVEAFVVPPFALPTDATAERTFRDLCGNADHPVGQHPEDYKLFRLATYSNHDGKITQGDDEPIAILDGLTARPKPLLMQKKGHR